MTEEITFGILRVSNDTSISLLNEIEDSFPIWKREGKKYKARFFMTDSGEIKIKGILIEEPEPPPIEPPIEPPVEEPPEKPAEPKPNKQLTGPEAIKLFNMEEFKALPAKEKFQKIEEILREGPATKREIAKKLFNLEDDVNQEGNWSEITYYLSPTFVMFRDRLEKDSVKHMGRGKGRKSTVWKLGEEKPIKATAEAIAKKTYKPKGKYKRYNTKVTPQIKEIMDKNPTLSGREVSILIKEKLGIKISGGTVLNYRKEEYRKDDSEISDSEVRPDIPHPTGETFMDKDEMADKIMDSMLDTPYKSRREINSIILGTTHPNSKEGSKVRNTLNTLLKFKIIEIDGSGDAPTYFLTDEGEEIAKNKRAKKETSK